MAEAFALADSRLLGEPLATVTKIRASEQAMLTNNKRAQALIDPFLAQYRQKISNKPQIVASSIFPLLYWRPYPDRRQDAAFQRLAAFLAQEQNSTTGIYALCKGYSLAGESHKAFEQIPVYQSERIRQAEFNYILLSLAHLKTRQPGDGWHEYDEAELTAPADYDGPVY